LSHPNGCNGSLTSDWGIFSYGKLAKAKNADTSDSYEDMDDSINEEDEVESRML